MKNSKFNVKISVSIEAQRFFKLQPSTLSEFLEKDKNKNDTKMTRKKLRIRN